MTTFRGIPINKAVIVRHSPDTHRSWSGNHSHGAKSASAIGSALAYASRTGSYEDKGEIDRTPTKDDMRLIQAKDAIDNAFSYAAREGTFADKGKERQIDASLWDGNGPISLEQAKREVLASGGGFIDSIVSVERKYANELGLDTKEGMQNLLRATWAKSVKEWNLIANPNDIRWVAAYHTDADMSFHAHIYTWSAKKDEIKDGARIGREATKRGKAVIHSYAYRDIIDQRNPYASYLRDLAVKEARVQLGFDVTEEQRNLLDKCADSAGYRIRLSQAPDLSARASESIGRNEERLRGELASSTGRLSRNYRGQAQARDIYEKLANESGSFRKIVEEYRSLACVKAELHGLSAKENKHDYAELVRKDMEDLKMRVVNGYIREYRPEPSLPRELSVLDARNTPDANISFSSKLHIGNDGVHDLVALPGNSGMYIKIPANDVQEVGSGTVMLARVRHDGEYSAYKKDGSPYGVYRLDDITKRFGFADMRRIAEQQQRFEARGEEDRRQAREYARRQRGKRNEHEQRTNDPSYIKVTSSVSRISCQYGMSKESVRSCAQDLRRLTSTLRGSASTYSNLSGTDRASVDRLARNIVSSSGAIGNSMEAAAKVYAAANNVDIETARMETKEALIASTRETITIKASSQTQAHGTDVQPSHEAGIEQSFSALGDVLASVSQSVGASGVRRSHIASRDHTQELEHSYEIQHTR